LQWQWSDAALNVDAAWSGLKWDVECCLLGMLDYFWPPSRGVSCYIWTAGHVDSELPWTAGHVLDCFGLLQSVCGK